MKIEEIVKEFDKYHTLILKPVSQEFTIEVNGSMNKIIGSKNGKAAILMGRFYENLTRCLYGGVLGEYSWLDIDGYKELVKPDVVDKEKNVIYECKSVCAGQHCQLQDDQLGGYDVLAEKWDLYYVLYRHNVKGIKSLWRGSAKKLLDDLLENTLYSLFMPFSLIKSLQNRSEDAKHLVYKYNSLLDKQGYDVCSCIKSSTMTRLLVEPKKVLQELGVDDSYTILRKKSPELMINNNLLKPFPIVKFVYKTEESRDIPF